MYIQLYIYKTKCSHRLIDKDTIYVHTKMEIIIIDSRIVYSVGHGEGN